MTFRLAVRALALALAPLAARAQGLTGTLVASNMTTSTVQLIDLATGTARASFPTAVAPHEVAVSHDGKWAVVAEYGERGSVGHSLLLLDLAKGAVARRIDLGDLTRPHGVKFLPGDRELVLTSEATKTLAIVDVASGEVRARIETGAAGTHMVSLSADARTAATTNVTGGSVSTYDLTSRTRTGLHVLGTPVEGMAMTPDGREVWAGGNSSRQVHVVDASSGAVLAAIPGFGFAYRIAITPDGKRAVVTDPGAQKVHLVDVASRTITTTIPFAAVNGEEASPEGVTLTPEGRHAFVTLKGAKQVVLLAVDGLTVVRTYTTEGGSDGVGYSPVIPGR